MFFTTLHILFHSRYTPAFIGVSIWCLGMAGCAFADAKIQKRQFVLFKWAYAAATAVRAIGALYGPLKGRFLSALRYPATSQGFEQMLPWI